MNFDFGNQNGFTFDFAAPFAGFLLPQLPPLPYAFPAPANMFPNNLPLLPGPSAPFIYPTRMELQQPAIDGTIDPSLISNALSRAYSPELASVDGDGESVTAASSTPADGSTVVVSPTGDTHSNFNPKVLQDPLPFERSSRVTPTHEMPSKRAASTVAATVSRSASGKFACPVDGCVKDFAARCSLARHLWSNGVACPQACGAIVRRGNDKATLDRHLRLFCKKTALATRLRNKALHKKTTTTKAKKGRGNARSKSSKRNAEADVDGDDDDYGSPPAKRARTL